MKIEEARMIVEDLKERFNAPFKSSDKEKIEILYYEVIGRRFVKTSCQQCYHDAVIEVYHYLKNNGKMAKKSKYRLRAGAIINCPTFKSGKVFSNENLTDKIAREYLGKFPNQVDMFEIVPDGENLNEDEHVEDEHVEE